VVAKLGLYGTVYDTDFVREDNVVELLNHLLKHNQSSVFRIFLFLLVGNNKSWDDLTQKTYLARTKLSEAASLLATGAGRVLLCQISD